MVLDASCLSRLLRLVEVSSKINTGQSEFACHVCARVKRNLSNCKDIFLHTTHTTAIFIHNKFDLLVFIYITIFLVYRLFATRHHVEVCDGATKGGRWQKGVQTTVTDGPPAVMHCTAK